MSRSLSRAQVSMGKERTRRGERAGAGGVAGRFCMGEQVGAWPVQVAWQLGLHDGQVMVCCDAHGERAFGAVGYDG